MGYPLQNTMEEIPSRPPKQPRVELVPLFLTIPFVTILLLIIILFSDFAPIINEEAASIFGSEKDYVAILQNICVGIITFILLLTVAVLIKRKRVPVWLFPFPIVFLVVVSYIFIFIINNDDFLTIHYIYQHLGYTLSLVIYLVIAAISLLCAGFLIHGFPNLWNTPQDDSSHFHPKILAIITLVGSILALYLLSTILFGHHSMIFWKIILYDFQWNSFIVVLHEILLVFFVFILVWKKYKVHILTKFSFDRQKFDKIIILSSPLVLLLQFILIIIMGIQKTFSPILLSPLSLLTYTLTLYYVLYKYVFPRVAPLSLNTIQGKKKRMLRTLIVVAPMIWIILFQPLISLPPEPSLPDPEIQVVKNTYSTLTTSQKTMFDEYLNGKVSYSTTAEQIITGSLSSYRALVRIASGLLFRNNGTDAARASIVINFVVKTLVVDEDGSFIGSDLILILEKHHELLNSSLLTSIKTKLVEIAEGAYIRNVRPTYSNIALMGAFIMEYVGIKMDIPRIRDAGIRKSWEIFILFNQNNTFSEYNSPTYYGADMLALALWRELGPTENMRKMGAIMETSFWDDIARHYHPGFKNMVGPYFRTYGMDMTQYYGIIGIWIALAINNVDNAPLPSGLPDNAGKYFEMSNILSAVQVGHSIPSSSILEKFTELSTPRFLERTIPSDILGIGKEYTATSTLHPDWMMGGVSGRIKDDGQFFTGILHWNTSDDSLAWLLVSGKDELDVTVYHENMIIRQSSRSTNITFYIGCSGILPTWINGSTWDLPGLTINIIGDPSAISAKMANSPEFKNDHDISHNIPTLIEVTCLMDEMTLKISK